jgi:hypothetical protein
MHATLFAHTVGANHVGEFIRRYSPKQQRRIMATNSCAHAVAANHVGKSMRPNHNDG